MRTYTHNVLANQIEIGMEVDFRPESLIHFHETNWESLIRQLLDGLKIKNRLTLRATNHLIQHISHCARAGTAISNDANRLTIRSIKGDLLRDLEDTIRVYYDLHVLCFVPRFAIDHHCDIRRLGGSREGSQDISVEHVVAIY